MYEVKKEKDLNIETLRGVAIILMVMAHVIGTTEADGLRVPDNSLYRWIYCLTENYRMPMFTVISGYVYAMRPLRKEMIIFFLKGKLRRLLYPLISVSTIQFIIRNITPGTNRKESLCDIWRIYIYPYDQFWFLQAIILVFFTVTVLEYFHFMENINKWLVCFIIIFIMQIFSPCKEPIFSFFGYLYLLVSFVLGVGIYRYFNIFIKNKINFAILFLFTVSIQQMDFFNILNIEITRYNIYGLVFGLLGSVFFLSFKWIDKRMAWIGSYSFDIYLFHVFGQAGSRIALKSLGIDNTLFLFITNLIFGLSVPILMVRILKKNSVARKYLLGLK